jgi:release factor glutamine methyltransferase
VADVLPFVAPGSRAGVRVDVLVSELTDTLTCRGNEHPRREALDIVAAMLDVPRHWASLHPTERLTEDVVARSRGAAARRVQGAPFAYAVGRAAFRYLTLSVDERVLIPRQETEMLVDLVLARSSGGPVADVGTGSGAIALALAAEGRFERVIGTDVSRGALDVARSNLAQLGATLRCPVEFREGSLLAPIRGERVSTLVSNPPYIAFEEADALPSSVRNWEPPVALLTSRGGMASITQLIREGASVIEPGGLLALEVDARRASLVAELAMTDGRYADVDVERDLTGRERFVLARRRQDRAWAG